MSANRLNESAIDASTLPPQGSPAATALPESDPDPPRIWIQSHYSSFNGLRGLAVFAVFLTHFGGYWRLDELRYFSWTGVDLFFVLSGFLITGILYDSLHSPRYFRDFYIRRSLRIFPLYFLLFILLFLLTPLLHLVYEPTLWFFALYLGNVLQMTQLGVSHNYSIISFLHHGQLLQLTTVGHLWSLCVEEQFYLLWPLAVWWVRDRGRLLRICITLCLVTPCVRSALFLFAGQPAWIEGSIFTRCDTLLAGAALALWLRGQPLSRRQLRRLASALYLPASIIVFLMLSNIHGRSTTGAAMFPWFVPTIGYTLIALIYVGVLLRSLDETGPFPRLLRSPAFAGLGVISYGFYLLHWLPEQLLRLWILHHLRWYMGIPIFAFGIAVILATLSFRYLETPFLRLKRTLAPQRVAEVPAHLHVSEPAA